MCLTYVLLVDVLITRLRTPSKTMATRTPKPTNSDLNLTTLSAKVPTSKLLVPTMYLHYNG